jgi:hypothetical protein
MRTSFYRIHQLRLRRVTRGLAFGIILAMAAIGSTHAADHGNRGGANRSRPITADRDWRDHQARAQHYWHRPDYVSEPGVVYAPPVVYSPPPQYQESGLNLIIPLHIH